MRLFILNRKVVILILILIVAFIVFQIAQYLDTNRYGFELIDRQKISEIDSSVLTFRHKKTGAKLIHIDNDDENKVFSINFRTPAEDNTGVGHIVEHSVFCGSQKYPVKNPFGELNKGSLNTFLNAATAPDYTMFPCASVNEKELNNLMDVYLDAVFYPNFYQNEQIFRQEGWRYELKDKNDALDYQGVVYNEMQGVYSSPAHYLSRNILNSLYPDTVYSKDSGGDPLVIPSLTSKEFLEYHKKYYHPSNSYIYLYGNLNLNSTLKYLNKEYLRKFSKTEIDSEIPLQEEFEEKKHFEGSYPLAKDVDLYRKSYLSQNYVLDENKDRELSLAFEVLSLVLDDNDFPLKKTLNYADIGENVTTIYEPGIRQPFFSIIAENAHKHDFKRFTSMISSSLEKAVDERIDPELLKRALNQVEVSLKQENLNAHRGLNLNTKVMSSWLYDNDPTYFLAYEDALKKLRIQVESNYFEKLIETYLLNNKHQSHVTVNPDAYLIDKNKEKQAKILTETTKKTTEAEVKEIRRLNEDLKKWQETPDKPEILEKIPKISLEDIKSPQPVQVLEKEIAKTQVLHHPFKTGELIYLDFYFDARKVPQEKLSYLYLLAELLGKVPTDNLSAEEVKSKLKMHTGGLYCELNAFGDYKDKDLLHPKFTVSTQVLESELPNLINILKEINTSKFTDTKKLTREINKVKLQKQNSAREKSEQIGIKRCLSYFNPAGKYNEQGFLSFNHFLEQLTDEEYISDEEIRDNLEEVSNLIFNQNDLLISVTCEKDKYEDVSDNLKGYLKDLDNHELKAYDFKPKLTKLNEGIISPNQVQHVIKGNNFKNLAYEYDGSMKVLEKIIDTEYLWDQLRVKGGAYGAKASFSSTGDFLLMSYRDPNLGKTLDVFNKVPKFLEDFKIDQTGINKYIIGALSDLDKPLSPHEQAMTSTSNHITKCSQADEEKLRSEILATDEKKIKKLTPLVAKMLEDDYHCVVGNDKIIKANLEYFTEIINLNSPRHPFSKDSK